MTACKTFGWFRACVVAGGVLLAEGSKGPVPFLVLVAQGDPRSHQTRKKNGKAKRSKALEKKKENTEEKSKSRKEAKESKKLVEAASPLQLKAYRRNQAPFSCRTLKTPKPGLFMNAVARARRRDAYVLVAGGS